jgi:hypothetical protein
MLRLISYLAPSIPAEFFELVARTIREKSGMDVVLAFEDRISGGVVPWIVLAVAFVADGTSWLQAGTAARRGAGFTPTRSRVGQIESC